METPILGSTYVTRSVNAANATMINLYPEVIPEGGKEPAFLTRCPGLKYWQSVGEGPIRQVYTTQSYSSRLYVASGNEFYLLGSLSDDPIKLGDISGNGPVSIADNGTQFFIACGDQGFIYNQSTNVFSQITDPDFPGATTVTYLDGYFVFNEPSSQRVWTSVLLDGTSVDPLDFASAEGSPDGVVAILADHRELVVFGTDTTEVWYNAALPDFPLAPIQGAFNEIGCISAWSIAKLDNSIFWLGTSPRGKGIVYRANGYTAIRVSTHAVEWQIQQYERITDAVGYSYQQEGHLFYVLNFPSANRTWVYDAATNSWHERASFIEGELSRHRSNCHCNFQGNTVVGDYSNGNIYTFDTNIYDDYGGVQKVVRSWRAFYPGMNDLRRTAQHSLQLDVETGVGLTEGQGSDPQVVLRWSDDGGHSWSNEHWRSLGPIGEYGRRVIWRRLGMTNKIRDRVYEISITDPVKVNIMGAQLLLSTTDA